MNILKTNWFVRWNINRQKIQRYSSQQRAPFFDLAISYLQSGPIKVIDIGCGFSDFAERVQQRNADAMIWMFDGNPMTVEKLIERGRNAAIYYAPNRLPFNNCDVEFIHCSHLIEHLFPQCLYSLLEEFDRVLAKGGVLAISAPLMWERFYDDLSHIRPYPPNVLDKYLTTLNIDMSFTRKSIGNFRREALFYRFIKQPVFSYYGLRSENWLIDFGILGLKKIAKVIGLYNLSVTGYTAIYRKEQ